MSEKLPNVSYYVPRGRRRYVIVVRYKGQRYTEAAGTKLVNVEKRARQLADQVDLVRSGLIKWEQLGLQIADRRQIGKHVDAFCEELTAKKRTADHVTDQRRKLKRLFELSRVERLSQMTLQAVRRGLDVLGRDHKEAGEDVRGVALQTLTHYVRAVKQFSKWAARRGKVPADPLGELAGFNAETDRRHERRAELPGVVEHLIAVTERAGRHRPKDLDGRDRAMAYRMAYWTGLRARELRKLLPEHFNLDAGTVNARAVTAKNRRQATITLTADMVARLRPWLAGRPKGVPVFKGMPLPAARMLRRDLKRAGIPYKTEAGVFDFHALGRVQLATDLVDAGTQPKVMQEIMRHADIATTMKHYAKARDRKKAEALEAVERMRMGGRDSGNVWHGLAPNGTPVAGATQAPETQKSPGNPEDSAIPAARLERATSGLGNRTGDGGKDLRTIRLSKGGKAKRAPSLARSRRLIAAAARRMGVRA